MVETRCNHGFLRSAVACPTCDPGRSRVEAASFEARRQPDRTRVRKRGQGETITREGAFRCRRCGIEKPLAEYYVSRTLTRGHQSTCKVCDNNKRTERLQRDRGYV